MCHWVLRVWKCGDSFFTKYSSCSFDRCAHDPYNLLNPLHPSIRPTELIDDIPQPHQKIASPANTGEKRGSSGSTNHKKRDKTGTNDRSKHRISHNSKTSTAHLTTPIAKKVPTDTPDTALVINGSSTYPRDEKTGETIPVRLSEIGKASRFGDITSGESGKCQVFEVVLQTQESTMCPACARSPKRAKLPAYARGCFGLS